MLSSLSPAALQLAALWMLILAALIADFDRSPDEGAVEEPSPTGAPSRCFLCGSTHGDVPCGCWEFWI